MQREFYAVRSSNPPPRISQGDCGRLLFVPSKANIPQADRHRRFRPLPRLVAGREPTALLIVLLLSRPRVERWVPVGTQMRPRRQTANCGRRWCVAEVPLASGREVQFLEIWGLEAT